MVRSNIVITHHGEVRFKNVAIVSKNGPAKLITYENTRRVITEFFGKVIPPDINHLLDLMTKQCLEGQEREEIYTNHPSVLPNLDVCWSFLKMYEVLKFRLLPPEREMIFLRLPYLQDWRQIACYNMVLLETYQHRSGSYELFGRPVTVNMRKLHEADKLLDFVRNGIAHWLQRAIHVTPLDHEIIIVASYPLLTPVLQEAMFDILGRKEYAKHFSARYTVKR